ncbi:MAG TPA: hypothetical protein PKG52_02975 [bacterium]|nr:hypothetical protein [bacterium]HPS30002.1 hypothetical protein [bacterium]
MNIHIFIDRAIVHLMKLVSGKRRIFSKSIESLPFEELIRTISLKVPVINGEGLYEVEAQTPQGIMNPAFKVVRWLGNDYPTFIYHHGNSEKPFKIRRFARNTFFKVFLNTNDPVEANLIALCSPMHTIPVSEYQRKMTELGNFTSALSVMAVLVENIISQLKPEVTKPIIVSGISFGGFVTNLHRAFFNTADKYIPLLASSSFELVFYQSIFKNLASELVLQNPEKLRQIVNFDEKFMENKNKNLFPLLGRYDQYINLEEHSKCYEGHPLVIVEKGHVTTAFSAETMRNHIFTNAGL